MQNPIPGTTREKNDGGYDADSGLDILVRMGTDCFCAANGKIIYSEAGHTPWNIPPDTANSVLIKLDVPLTLKGIKYNYIWYTHLSWLKINVPDGSTPVPIKAGELVGRSGIGNKVAHLHFGILGDRAQTVTMPQNAIANLIWSEEANPPQSEKLKVFQKDNKYHVYIPDGTKGGWYWVDPKTY